MPRIVDPQERRALLADAVWRVVAREGVDQASVRRVADEAGVSPGSLRHYFTSQAELLGFALELVGARLDHGLASARADEGLDPVARVTAMIEEMLPLDDARRLECQVWLAFTARSLVDPTLARVQAEVDQRLETAFDVMISVLADGGVLRADRDPGVERERLYALVDGLIVHGLLRHAGAGGPSSRAVVAAHLREITVAS